MPRERDFNTLNTWLPPKIEALGISIEKFARRAKLSRAQLYRYFRDISRPTDDAMVRMCHVLGVPVEEGFKQYVPKKTGRPVGSGGGPREVRTRSR